MSEYDGYSIEQLWQMVDAAREGLQPSHDQVAALRRAQHMLSGHAAALQDARDQLAAKWPPESNAASAAYLTELDRLITAVKDTALSCAVNVFHINTVSDAIVQAHDTLAPLHAEYAKNKVALAQYEADVKSLGDGASLIPGGSAVASGAVRLFTSPPVEDGRQDDLVRRARQAMQPLASAAADGATYIQPPPPYEPPTVNSSYWGDDPKQIGSSGFNPSGSAVQPPKIEPPAYVRTSADDSAIPAAHDRTSAGDRGLILSGLTPTPVQPALTPPPPPGVGTGGGAPIGSLPPVIPGIGGRMPGAPTPGRPGPGRSPFGASPGGVIGGIPEVSLGTPRPIGSVSPGSTPARVSPPGGIIGQQPSADGNAAARRTSGRTVGSGATGMMAPQASRQQRGRPAADGQRWDPDNRWAVNEGVVSVIRPDMFTEDVDPGPGIIGMDR